MHHWRETWRLFAPSTIMILIENSWVCNFKPLEFIYNRHRVQYSNNQWCEENVYVIIWRSKVSLITSQETPTTDFGHASYQFNFREVFQCSETCQNLLKGNNDAGKTELFDANPFHKQRMDALDLKCAVNEFIGDSTHRGGIFAKYWTWTHNYVRP